MKVPVFMFNGILESGKTAFIKEFLDKPVFKDGKNTLLIVCEEGEEEYDAGLLEKQHVVRVTLEEEKDLTNAFLKEMNKKYKPARVIIEYNGMWNLVTFYSLEPPTGWFMYQNIVLLNGETFNVYINNMRQMMVEHFKVADLVLINRMQEDTNIGLLKGAVKSVSSRARLFEEAKDFALEPIKEDLPYDMSADIVEISKEDFGIWYVDLWDEPKKYIGKQVKVSGMFFQDDSDPKDCFTFGRFAMPCCEEDISLMGVYCHNIGKPKFKDKDDIEIIGTINWGEAPVYEGGEGPILQVKSIQKTSISQQEMVTF